MKKLYYGDNLEILRRYIKDDSIDLCYIDPPFNSKRNYNQIYNNIGSDDKAQAQAFIDTWTWDDEAVKGFEQITTNYNGVFTKQSIELIIGLEKVLGKGDLLAYLISMTLRIAEIFRVLKPTGSFYLHCDPTANQPHSGLKSAKNVLQILLGNAVFKLRNMKTIFALIFVSTLIFYGCSSGPKPKAQSSPVTSTEQVTEWKLEFPNVNQDLTRQLIYSLDLTINGTDIFGYYVTEVSKSKLTGTILNDQVNMDIPGVSGDVGMKMKGTMTNNNLIRGMCELYISNKTDWSKDDLNGFKESNPDEPFIATKK